MVDGNSVRYDFYEIVVIEVESVVLCTWINAVCRVRPKRVPAEPIVSDEQRSHLGSVDC